MIRKKLGFTLIELLIAIAIFAVLSALGWKVFDHIAHVKDRNMVREKMLIDLQTAYQVILKDSLQIIPIAANINNQMQPSLILENNRLVFNKAGVVDPLQQGKSPFERIEYLYNENEKSVLRLKYQNLNHAGNDIPESSVFLRNVDEFRVEVLNPDALVVWPMSQNVEAQDQIVGELPKGIKFDITQNGVKYEWIFSLLNTEYLKTLKNTNSTLITSENRSSSNQNLTNR
ncbi:type II secretion system protein GspJ [Acinetobacter equi]|uniref:type II secretion system protein GspJ n=1 Tax=Acinetobacter equi TaxID=1324350 RepID=UPI0009D6FB96|nr:type II secretion system protein GspJ [Acinetobacter equi]